MAAYIRLGTLLELTLVTCLLPYRYGAVWSTYEEYRNHANSNNKARNHDAASGPRNKASNKRSRRRIEEEWPGENAPRYQDWSQLQTPGAEAQRSKDYQKKQKINSKQTSAKLGLTVGSTSNDPTRRARSTS